MTAHHETKDLSALNTLALPCVAHDYTEVSSREALTSYLSGLDSEAPLLVLGGGSNLVLPEALSVPVLQIVKNDVRYEKSGHATLVHVSAGVEWDALVAAVVAKGLRGLENLSLIPGTVGAAPVQNIGAYGVELKDHLLSVEVFDRKLNNFVMLDAEQCDFSYRDSIFKRNAGRFVIFEVTFRLSPTTPFTLGYGELKSLSLDEALDAESVRNAVIAVRQAKLPDPSELPNAGSFFKNPVVSAEQFEVLQARHPNLVAYEMPNDTYKLAAGWLIDQAGWKGESIGPITIHKQQALVLTNVGKATQTDVLVAARILVEDIHVRYGVVLEIEPVVVGSNETT